MNNNSWYIYLSYIMATFLGIIVWLIFKEMSVISNIILVLVSISAIYYIIYSHRHLELRMSNALRIWLLIMVFACSFFICSKLKEDSVDIMSFAVPIILGMITIILGLLTDQTVEAIKNKVADTQKAVEDINTTMENVNTTMKNIREKMDIPPSSHKSRSNISLTIFFLFCSVVILVIGSLTFYKTNSILTSVEFVQETADSILTQNAKIQTSVEFVQETADSILTQNTKIQTSVESVQETADSIQTKTDSILTKVSDLETEIDTLKTQMRRLLANIDSL